MIRPIENPDDTSTALRPRPRRLSAPLFLAVLLCGMTIGASPSVVFAQLGAVWSATPVAQTNGSSVKMPFKRAISRSSGLALMVDTRWSPNYGYRPIEVSVTSLKPATADRSITIRLHTGWSGRINIEQDFKLPSGSATAATIVALPQYQMATPFYWWEVWVDGVKDKDLTLERGDAYSVMQSGYSSISGKAFLAMTSKSGERSLVAPSSEEFQVLSLATAEFPRRWIDYTCLDVITLSLSELTSVSQKNPTAFQAMRRWVRAGGQLWVNDVGQQYEELAKLSKLLQLRDSTVNEMETGGDSIEAGKNSFAGGWQAVRFVNGNPEGQVVTFLDHKTGSIRTVRDPDIIARLQGDSNYSMTGQRFQPADETSAVIGETSSRRWFVEQRLGLGTVRAFRATNEVTQFQRAKPAANPNVAANEEEPAGMPPSLTAALQSVVLWDARHGLVPDDANLEFGNLLVPGVGKAPVTEFRVLITLFVLLIGPVNYWLLKHWRRLHLMVLTVPLAAGLVTVALFAYAIVSDGFGTKVRAHSLTTLDQRTGESACWTRLSYYSGLAPGRGLTMPADVVMYPIIPGWSPTSTQAYVAATRDLRWENDEVKMKRGWLRSRTPTQYLTIRARKSPHRLELTPVREKMRAKNQLGTTINFLVIIDEENKLWTGEQLSAEAVAFLQPAERIDAVARLRKLVTENSPKVPAALAGEDSSYAIGNQWRMYAGRYGPYSSGQSLETNLANIALADIAGLEGREGLALPPRTYVAVTATGPEVEFGMDGAEEEFSFHVVVGQW